ncbi:MAG: hypothetical protein AB1346_11890, partial [Thermodesulfobacteriota bacterium]
SRTVLWMDGREKTRKTDGIRFVAVSFRPRKGLPVAAPAGDGTNVTGFLPERLSAENVRMYSWESWETPVYHTYLKKSYFIVKEAFAAMPETV